MLLEHFRIFISIQTLRLINSELRFCHLHPFGSNRLNCITASQVVLVEAFYGIKNLS